MSLFRKYMKCPGCTRGCLNPVHRVSPLMRGRRWGSSVLPSAMLRMPTMPKYKGCPWNDQDVQRDAWTLCLLSCVSAGILSPAMKILIRERVDGSSNSLLIWSWVGVDTSPSHDPASLLMQILTRALLLVPPAPGPLSDDDTTWVLMQCRSWLGRPLCSASRFLVPIRQNLVPRLCPQLNTHQSLCHQ